MVVFQRPAGAERAHRRSHLGGGHADPAKVAQDSGLVSRVMSCGHLRVTFATALADLDNGGYTEPWIRAHFPSGASITQAEVDANTPPVYVLTTEMLTVWRRVWLELDSMAGGTDISYTGEIDAITNNSPHAGDGTVELDVPDIDDDGRFEGGTMTVVTPAGTNAYTIIDNVDVFVDDDYTMSTPVAAGDLGMPATVVDDDTATLPHTPNASIAVLNAKYHGCYLEFTENAATRDLTNTFTATLENSSAKIRDVGMENADLTASDIFWVARVVTCYQPHHTTRQLGILPNASQKDGDPDSRYHVHPGSSLQGDQDVILGWTVNSTFSENVSVILYETMLDAVRQFGGFPGIGFMEPYVIAHEIGHQFGLPDIPAGSATLMQPYDGMDYDLSAVEIGAVRSSDLLGIE